MIDYKKSMLFQRLIIKTSFLDKIGVLFVWILGSTALISMSLSMLIGSLKFNWFNDSATEIILAQIISFSIFLFVMAGLIINNNLIRVKITSNENPRDVVKNSLKLFNERIIHRDNEKELVLSINSGPFAYNRHLIALFENQYVYLNCRTYARGDLISPVHWVVHKRIINKLIKEINTRQPNKRP
ncbi:hypothetical protein [Marinifilum caeruleilacunae]|uniref:DUF304 domain-containing protein n=1 Tax=Marinifilum caeruleilacunae TaxID=2499076 RepID=A0ABX1WUL2_9BACT|nr:hypothetical protein [Marinifilum caeruleilacunae]NOU59618.1 hypothetical protein [Marinifilum caeruleilacunae]